MTGDLDELRDLLGPRAVLGPGDGLDAYQVPARGAAGPTAAVVRPASTGEVRAVVGWARRHRVRLLPQGANTGLVGASTPPPAGDAGTAPVVLSTQRLTEGLVVDPADRTALVPAGLRLSALDEAAAAHGLTFPIDLAADPTLGGMVATNTGGARMLRYGDVRRRVLGVEAVIADEAVSVVDDLTVLRKDNTGLALGALFVGSSGALGIITRVAVELARRPAERSAMLIVPDGAEGAVAALGALEAAHGDRLSAFEVMSAEAVAAAVDHVAGVPRPFDGTPPPLVALVELSGPVGVGDELLAAVEELVTAGHALDAVALPPGGPWALRHALSEGLARAGVVVGFDVSVPRSALAPFRARARNEVRARFPRVQVADFGHWGDGGMHCNVVFPAGEPPAAEERDALREVVFGLAVDGFGGSFSAEHGIGPHNVGWWRRTTPEGNRVLGAALKAAMDPLGVLGHPGLPYADPSP